MKEANRIIIGIPGIPMYNDEKYSVIAIEENYKLMAIEKGLIPFMIPPIQSINYIDTSNRDIPALTENEMEIYKEMIDMCDGILIPGGYRMYNYHNFIIKYAIDNNIPLLGTCLGMQNLACIDNQEYCLEKNSDDRHKKRGELYVHNVKIVPDTMLSKIIGNTEIKVNSVHQYHVSHVNNFIVSAYSDDGLIEAIELPGKDFVLGVQWHPEKIFKYDENANKIIDSFIGACMKNKMKKD